MNDSKTLLLLTTSYPRGSDGREAAGSFVADLAHPDVNRIVQAIMALGQGLNMTITAEGVETQAQLDIVRAKGCNEVQGYYFSRPLTAADFRSFIGGGAEEAEVA